MVSSWWIDGRFGIFDGQLMVSWLLVDDWYSGQRWLANGQLIVSWWSMSQWWLHRDGTIVGEPQWWLNSSKAWQTERILDSLCRPYSTSWPMSRGLILWWELEVPIGEWPTISHNHHGRTPSKPLAWTAIADVCMALTTHLNRSSSRHSSPESCHPFGELDVSRMLPQQKVILPYEMQKNG